MNAGVLRTQVDVNHSCQEIYKIYIHMLFYASCVCKQIITCNNDLNMNNRRIIIAHSTAGATKQRAS